MKIPPPLKTPTPYGGRLTWVLPGGNFLIAHIKDKTKIRHKKRWSQVMYMYYLLGYRLFGDLNIIEKLYKRKRKKNCSKSKSKLFKGFGNLLNNMDNKKRIQVDTRARADRRDTVLDADGEHLSIGARRRCGLPA